jgi:hypothetical protein
MMSHYIYRYDIYVYIYILQGLSHWKKTYRFEMSTESLRWKVDVSVVSIRSFEGDEHAFFSGLMSNVTVSGWETSDIYLFID